MSDIVKENENLLKNIDNYKINNILSNESNLQKINNFNVLAVKKKQPFNPKAIVDVFLEKFASNTICIFGIDIDKPVIVLCGTNDVAEKYNLGKIVKETASKIGGGGGGPKHFGTSGFKDKAKFNELYDLLFSQIKLMK